MAVDTLCNCKMLVRKVKGPKGGTNSLVTAFLMQDFLWLPYDEELLLMQMKLLEGKNGFSIKVLSDTPGNLCLRLSDELNKDAEELEANARAFVRDKNSWLGAVKVVWMLTDIIFDEQLKDTMDPTAVKSEEIEKIFNEDIVVAATAAFGKDGWLEFEFALSRPAGEEFRGTRIDQATCLM